MFQDVNGSLAYTLKDVEGQQRGTLGGHCSSRDAARMTPSCGASACCPRDEPEELAAQLVAELSALLFPARRAAVHYKKEDRVAET